MTYLKKFIKRASTTIPKCKISNNLKKKTPKEPILNTSITDKDFSINFWKSIKKIKNI